MTRAMNNSTLAIVIPAWNSPNEIRSLLHQVSEIGIFSEIVISDDGSQTPCDLETLGFTQEQFKCRVIYLRSDVQRGAGHARNLGLSAVSAHNVIFFDADDKLAPDISAIWQQHLNADFPDFTIFRHSDTRVREAEGREGTFKTEEILWDLAMGSSSFKILTLAEAAELCSLSNYPWNKIYRTDFLRDHEISCSETPVHNDIRLHWLSFIKARRIQADARIGALHIIDSRGHHLTMRKGEDRLCLGSILEDLTKVLQSESERIIFMRSFIKFSDNICRWNLNNIESHVTPSFKKIMLDTYMRFRPEDFRVFAEWQPAQANKIVDFLLCERP